VQSSDKDLIELILLGAVIGVGKLLLSEEKLTPRVILGRAIMGSATSLVAGVALMEIPGMQPMTLLGIGSALGILGQQYLEKILRKKLAQLAEKGKVK
jgi:hypothetical protein